MGIAVMIPKLEIVHTLLSTVPRTTTRDIHCGSSCVDMCMIHSKELLSVVWKRPTSRLKPSPLQVMWVCCDPRVSNNTTDSSSPDWYRINSQHEVKWRPFLLLYLRYT